MNHSTLNTHPHLLSPKYRADIDGLRAIAILIVVGYHAFPEWVRGGFVGVDVFFVISGFLISTIILGSLEDGGFSFGEFYARRIKRIFPALILVLAACYALGWFVLLSDEYRQLGKHIAAGAGFVSNLFFWQEAGYFDNAAETKPLLHLWSLGVEEQFYIIWPLLLYWAWKKRTNLLFVTLAIIAVSFAVNVDKVSGDAAQAFYSPLSRFWELTFGSMLAGFTLYEMSWKGGLKRRMGAVPAGVFPGQAGPMLQNIRSAFGLLLIGAAVLLVSKEKVFPGWWALLPTLGASLIISAGPQAWLNRTLLSSRAMVWIGLISYPLYLWHWPLLSFAYIVKSGEPTPVMRMALVLLAVVLAGLTYRLVERPLRFGRELRAKVFALCVLMLAVGIAGYDARSNEGFEFREVVSINSQAINDSDINVHNVGGGCGIRQAADEEMVQNCVSDDRGNVRFALVGDSKAAVLAPGLFNASTDNGHWLFIGGWTSHGATVPVISNEPVYENFQSSSKIALDALAGNPDVKVVVFTTATRNLFRLNNETSIDDLPASPYAEVAFAGLDGMISALIRAGKKVVITVDNPTFRDPKQCIRRITSLSWLNRAMNLGHDPSCSVSYDRHLELTAQYRMVLDRLQAKYPDKLRIFDTLGQLCDMEDRMCTPFHEGRLLYSYGDHISQYASTRIAAKLVPFVEDFAREER
ncbi:MAG: acyltransferase [Nitrosomonadales bacterium]|nr:acyltransferase [Nitrosomonadales bacterium]